MTQKKSLQSLARENGITFSLSISSAIEAAAKLNPTLKLDEVSSEDMAELTARFQQYCNIQVTQVANLRSTIGNPVKHLALDLVAILKGGETLEAAGLSQWFANSQKVSAPTDIFAA